MRHKLLLSVIIASILFCFSVSFAIAADPIPLNFTKAGGGQWIYCNNPEYINIGRTSTIENPYASYMMKNDGLKPDKYSVFFCFYNSTNFDVEPDIEFASKGNAQVTINSISYYIPWGDSHMDCIGAWSDQLNLNIRSMDGTRQYVPYKGETSLPKTITLNNSNDWISPYIYNYQAIRPLWCFNMLVEFTVDSGEVDLGFIAAKNFGELSDRTFQDPDAWPGFYIQDNTVKGIETESLPIVEADINIKIDNTTKNGENLPFKVFNQYFPKGNVVSQFMTNINPNKDGYLISKESAASSDMLSLQYKDDSKLRLYGKNVPESEKSDIWHMDIYHNDSREYESDMPVKADDYKPNEFTSNTFDVKKPPSSKWQFNLGNYGVTYRYHLSISNTDSTERFVNYMIDGSLSSNIVIVRDQYGNPLNPYTHDKEDPFGLSKAMTDKRTSETLFSVGVMPNETKKFILDVILPTNCYGGIINSFNVDDRKYIKEIIATDFPTYSSEYQYSNVFFNGEKHMKLEDGRLYELNDDTWEYIKIPNSAKKVFSQHGNEFIIKKTPVGYAAKFSGWDGTGIRDSYNKENKLHFFDNDFNHLNTAELPAYIYEMEVSFDGLYVFSDKIYVSTDYATFKPVEGEEDGIMSFPVSNGYYTIIEKSGQEYIGSPVNDYSKVAYESTTTAATGIHSADEVFYYKKSWKGSYTDLLTKNILAVSKDGIFWVDVELPDKYLDLVKVNYISDTLHVDCNYENYTFSNIKFENNIKVSLDNEYLVFNTPPKTINGRVMVPLRFFFEKLEANVQWNDQLKMIYIAKDDMTILLQLGSNIALVNGKQVRLDSPAYLDDDKTLIPLRFLGENLGYTVNWYADKLEATIKSKE